MTEKTKLDIEELRKDALKRAGRDETGQLIKKESSDFETRMITKIDNISHDITILREQVNKMIHAFNFMQKGMHDKMRDVEKAMEKINNFE